MSNLTKNLTITPTPIRGFGIFHDGMCTVMADQKHVGWVRPASGNLTPSSGNLTWVATNICGDETEGFPTKIDAAAYISNNVA